MPLGIKVGLGSGLGFGLGTELGLRKTTGGEISKWVSNENVTPVRVLETYIRGVVIARFSTWLRLVHVPSGFTKLTAKMRRRLPRKDFKVLRADPKLS